MQTHSFPNQTHSTRLCESQVAFYRERLAGAGRRLAVVHPVAAPVAPVRAKSVPAADFIADRRRTKLRCVLSHIEAVTSFVSLDPSTAETRARIVTMAAVELAILDHHAHVSTRGRETLASENGIAWIVRALGTCRETSEQLWTEHAPKAFSAYRHDFEEHVERARNSRSSVFNHRKIVDLASDELGRSLGLTRPIIKAMTARGLFGEKRCQIVPMKVRVERFDRVMTRRLNDLSRHLCVSADHVKNVYAEKGQAGLDELCAQRKERVAKHFRKSKIGRPRKSVTVQEMVAEVAADLGISEPTVYRRMAEFKRAADPDELEREAQAHGISVSEAVLNEVFHAERFSHSRKKCRRVYPDKDAVIAHHTHMNGGQPSTEAMRNWHRRGLWTQKADEAVSWRLSQISKDNIETKETTDAQRNYSAEPIRPAGDERPREVEPIPQACEASADGNGPDGQGHRHGYEYRTRE